MSIPCLYHKAKCDMVREVIFGQQLSDINCLSFLLRKTAKASTLLGMHRFLV